MAAPRTRLHDLVTMWVITEGVPGSHILFHDSDHTTVSEFNLRVRLRVYDTHMEVTHYSTRHMRERTRHDYEYANPAFPQNLLNFLETIRCRPKSES